MAICPVCNHDGAPYVIKQVSQTGWIVFAILLVTTCVLAWIPFVVDGLKEEVHKCSNCGTKLGVS